MATLYWLLVFLSGVALIVVLLKTRPTSRARRLEDWEENKMELGARICETAARDAFGIELDHSDESIAAFDRMISEEWPHELAVQAEADLENGAFDEASIEDTYLDGDDAPAVTPNSVSPAVTQSSVSDSLFVFASYLGDVLVRHHGAVWRMDTETHHWPYLFFTGAELAASPFDMIEKKLADPKGFSLKDAAERLLAEVERRKNLRATSWHLTEDDRNASFAPLEQTATEPPAHSSITQTSAHPSNGESTPDQVNGEVHQHIVTRIEAANGSLNDTAHSDETHAH